MEELAEEEYSEGKPVIIRGAAPPSNESLAEVLASYMKEKGGSNEGEEAEDESSSGTTATADEHTEERVDEELSEGDTGSEAASKEEVYRRIGEQYLKDPKAFAAAVLQSLPAKDLIDVLQSQAQAAGVSPTQTQPEIAEAVKALKEAETATDFEDALKPFVDEIVTLPQMKQEVTQQFATHADYINMAHIHATVLATKVDALLAALGYKVPQPDFDDIKRRVLQGQTFEDAVSDYAKTLRKSIAAQKISQRPRPADTSSRPGGVVTLPPEGSLADWLAAVMEWKRGQT